MALLNNYVKLKQINIDDRKECVASLSSMFSNILKYPMEQKYQRFSMKTILRKFEKFPVCIDILYNAGFVKSKNGKKLVFNYNNMRVLKKANQLLLKTVKPEISQEVKHEVNEFKHSQKFDDIFQQYNESKFEEQDEKLIDISSQYLLTSTAATHHQCELASCAYLLRICKILNAKEEEQKVHSNNVVNLLNDFNHILFMHSDDFEEIYNISLTHVFEDEPCDISNCLMMMRNKRERAKISKNEQIMNQLYANCDNVVVQQLIDRIHCYIFHSFDIGYKITNKEKQEI
eukprot:229606_1